MLDGRVDSKPPEKTDTSAFAADTFAGPELAVDLLDQRNIVRPYNWQQFEYPFIYGQIDPDLFPVNDWREACRLSLRVDAISRWAQDRVDHDDDLLVEQIHTRVLPRRGVWADKEEILITTGAQNALFLIAQLLLNQDSVAVSYTHLTLPTILLV